MGILKLNFKLKELKVEWWLKRQKETRTKEEKTEEMKTLNCTVRVLKGVLNLKEKILLLFHYALFLFHPFFRI